MRMLKEVQVRGARRRTGMGTILRGGTSPVTIVPFRSRLARDDIRCVCGRLEFGIGVTVTVTLTMAIAGWVRPIRVTALGDGRRTRQSSWGWVAMLAILLEGTDE